MLLYIFSILLLLLIVYVLFVPITLVIDTLSHQYYIKVKGLAKACIKADEYEIIKIHLRAFRFDFFFYPLKIRSGDKSEKSTKAVKKRTSKSISAKKVWRVLRSFEVKYFQLDIDTGNCISNAKLYPVFAFLNFYSKSTLNVNFEGRNSVLLDVENRPIRIIRSFINI